MPVKLQVVMNAMEKIAPRHLTESWDNAGLMVGDPSQTIERILVSLDADETAVDRAISDSHDLIVAHHPLIFKPLKHLRADLPEGRALYKLVKNDIAVFSAHTNLDAAKGGVNDCLAELLSLTDLEPLDVTRREPLVKLTVFSPRDHADAIRSAIAKAGAGAIGGYTHCSFQTMGEGRFLPEPGTNPFIGKVGAMETVEEARIETIMPEKIAGRVVKAMLKAHPYEEAAYDLYPLRNTGDALGIGRIGRLAAPMEIGAFAEKVKSALPVAFVRLVKSGERPVRKVALCGGSGADYLMKAAYAGADVLVTGDVKYHDAQKAIARGIHVVDAGHFGTEAPIVKALARRLARVAENEKWDVSIAADERSEDLFQLC